MQIEQLLASMSPAVFDKLKTAIETGKWLDGKPLSEQQKETVMQAVLLYQAKVEQSEQHMTIGKDGEIVHKSKRELVQELKHDQQEKIARFKQDDF